MELVVLILLGASLILFFGFFAEFIFRKLKIPDVLLLIALGFLIGPYGLKFVSPADVMIIAPVFTTFALIFLLFDGAFNIHLYTLISEFFHSFVLTLFNFVISAAIVTGVMVFAGFPLLISLLTGFILGGVSSSFVIPVLKQLKISEKIYSLLTLESALTDVLCIVFALTVVEIIHLGSFGVQNIFSQIMALFSIGGLVGVIAGVIWIILILKVFKEHNYIMVVACLLLVYVAAEFLSGSGAIAALFFGLMLKNSKQLSSIIRGILSKKAREKKMAIKGELGVSVTTPSEETFYHQISFFLKTFFFVYIGLLIDLSDWKALVIGGVLSVILMGSRMSSLLLTRKLEEDSRSLVNSVFARGIAAAVLAQFAVQFGVPHADFIGKVAYVVITGTIFLSSIRIFIFLLKNKDRMVVEEEKEPQKKKRKRKKKK